MIALACLQVTLCIFDRYWLLKFGIIIGMCVGAFYIPRDYEFGLGIFSY